MSTAPAPDLADLLRSIRASADDPDKTDTLVDDLAFELDLPRTARERPAGLADTIASLWAMDRAAREGHPRPNSFSRALLRIQSMLGVRQEVNHV